MLEMTSKKKTTEIEISDDIVLYDHFKFGSPNLSLPKFQCYS